MSDPAQSTLLGGRSQRCQENAAETPGPLGASEHGSHSVGEPMKMPLGIVALDRLAYLGMLIYCDQIHMMQAI